MSDQTNQVRESRILGETTEDNSIKRVVIRMEQYVYSGISMEAKRSRRSLNSEFVYRLQHSLGAEAHWMEFVQPDSMLTESERLLLNKFRALNPEQKIAIVSMLSE